MRQISDERRALSPVLASALAKVERGIVPLLFIGYMLAILDRGAISLAALQMNASLGLSATQFAFAASAFFVGYLVFEIPSNLLLQRFGAPLWIARIMLTWGLATSATAFVVGPYSFAAMRFLLGASEAGFLPGVIYYLSQWFPPHLRAKVIANFTLSIPLISAVGALISGALLNVRGLGLEGWQWLFVLEGAPCLLLAWLIWRRLPRRIETASFLDQDEKAALVEGLGRPEDDGKTPVAHVLGHALRRLDLWALGLINLGFIICAYAIGLWLPQIVRGYGVETGAVAWIVALPSAVGALAMLAWGRWGKGGSAGELMVILTLAAAFLTAASAMILSPLTAIVLFTLASAALSAAIPAFWTLASRIAGARAAAEIAMVNTIGSLSGVMGPPLVGYLKDRTGSFASGFYAVTAFLLISILLLAALSTRRASATPQT